MSRRFQFSLRSLLALMLAVACFSGGVYVESRWHIREKLRPEQPLYFSYAVPNADGQGYTIVRKKIETDPVKRAKAMEEQMQRAKRKNAERERLRAEAEASQGDRQ